MPEFLNKFLDQIKKIYSELSNTVKIIIGVSLLVVIGFLVFVASYSTTETRVPLYSEALSQSDFEKASKFLEEAGVDFTTKDGKYLFVDNNEIATKMRTEIGMKVDTPSLKGFEIFQVGEYSNTDFERNVNLRVAITKAIESHLESLDEIEKARVQIAWPQDDFPFYLKEMANRPLEASVVLSPAPYSDIAQNKNKIKGLRNLIAKGVDRLDPDHVIILDNSGNVLTDLLDNDGGADTISLARQQIKIRETLRGHVIQDLNKLMSHTFSEEGYILEVNLELNWEKTQKSGTKIIPIVLKEDNPATPYFDGETIPSIRASEKTVTEEFKGPAFIPEGAPGTEFNIPPGMKQFADRFTMYQKNENMTNYDYSQEDYVTESPPYSISKISVAAILDSRWERGEWQEDKEKFVRTAHPIDDAIIRKVKELIESYNGLDAARGDKVSVHNIAFNHEKTFSAEDEEHRNQLQNKRWGLIIASIVLFCIIVALVWWKFNKYLEQRRRHREEELARQAQAMREAALRAAEEEGFMVDMSPEDKARLEMQENAINLARERPEDVAQLIRTWISAD